MEPLRFVIFDETDTGSRASGGPRRATDGTLRGSHGLTWIWRLGAVMHRRSRCAVSTRAVSSWSAALRWIVAEAYRAGRPITEVQVWGHGGWGFMMLGGERLDVDAIAEGGPLGTSIDALRDALSPDALVWLRCCSAFGNEAGHRFASTLAERLRVRVAGHTHIIGA